MQTPRTPKPSQLRKRSQLRWSDALIILTTIAFLAVALRVQMTKRPADFLSAVIGGGGGQPVGQSTGPALR